MREMDFAFVPLRIEDDKIYLATNLRRQISTQAEGLRHLIEDDQRELGACWKSVIEIGQNALYAAAQEAGDAEMGTVWQVGAMAMTEPSRLGKELGRAKDLIAHWQALGEKVESQRDRWIEQEPSERRLVHMIFNIVDLAETADYGISPAELARIAGMAMYVAGYLGLKIGRPEAGVPLAVLAAMDELELLTVEAGQVAVVELKHRGLDVSLGAAMPFLVEEATPSVD